MSASAATPHIFTLTGNLLAERTFEFERWEPGRTQRATAASFQVGGKGINVARMLTRLGVANTALCFTGGSIGDECSAWLRQQGFACRSFPTVQPTRSGLVVRDRSGTHRETTFLGIDAPPDAQAVAACAEFLNANAKGNVLALCGSFPGWSSADFAPLRAAIDRWRSDGVLVVDTYGAPLADLVRAPLALLKINADELRSLNAERVEDLPSHLEHVIISDGPRQICFRDSKSTVARRTPPEVREISPTGSGDVLLACVLEAWIVRRLPLAAALDFAIPYAAANAAHPGIAEFPLPRGDS
jgi:1-phosphofructokinase